MDPAEYETNALVLNNISAVAYAFYEPVSPPPNFYVSGALEFEGALRCDGHLAYVDAARRGLWCFRLQKKDDQPGSSSFDKSLDCQGLNLVLVEEGLFEPASLLKSRGYGASATNTPSSSSSSASNPLDVGLRGIQATSFPGGLNDQEVKMLSGHETRGAATTTVRDAYQHFISAILSALTSTLCMRSGALPLNSRTLLLPQRIQDESGMNIPILASFRVYLTTTGTLVVMLNVSSVKGLHSLSEYAYPPLHGITVLAAPLGVFATCQAIADSEYSSNNSAMPQSPDTQVSRLRPERELGHWRSICAKLLQARNLPSPISGTQKWLSLQRVRRKPTDQSYDGKRTPMITAAPTSLSWPSNLCFCKALSKLSITDMSSSSPDGSFDPLANAKTWFNSTAEREELLARKKQEREAASAQQTSTNSQPQTGAGLSPIALHRPSNAGVPPGAMYPTPPDGVQNAVGFTPSMDGTISSPGHQPNTTAAVDIDTTVSLPAESFAEPAWETQEPKRERGGSSFDSENLFGDLGPDMFGDNDITDADFSFFDEQPGGMDMALDSVDLSGADRLLDMAQDFNTAPVAEVAPRPPLAPPPSAPPAPVFAKPELKHARSSLNEQPRRNTESDIERQRPVVVKRQASPFNPDTVFKRIKASFDTYTIPQLKSNWNTPQPGSIFDKVDFSPSLSLVNRKYQGNGRFSFSLDRDQELKPIAFEAPPTTGYLRRHGKGRRILKDPPANVGELFARMTTGPGIASQHPSPTKLDDPASDADELSVVSDQDDSSYESDEAPSPDKTGSVRRRRLDDDEQSLATSFRELEYPDAASPHSSVDLPKFSKSDVDLPLARYFADAEPRNSQLMIPDNDFIIAAQLLTEQACTSTLGFATDPTVSLQSKLSRWRELLSITDLALQELRSDLPPWFNDLDDQLFKPFLEVQDVPLLGQPTRMQPRPPGAEQLKPSNPFQIPSPRFEMRRYDTKHIVLPSAVTFWESLGLGPSNGSKDIQAVCIYPEAEGLADDVDGFLNKMQGSYESLRLGSFSRMSASPDFPGGLFPHESETPGQDFNVTGSTLSASLVNGLTKLSDVLSHLSVKEINVVVFFVYSTSIHASPAECCYAFHQLFERYKKLLLSSRKPVENDLVLQLVPRDFLASSTSIVSPSPLDYARLAVETYDRCTMFGGAMPAPAIVLEQTIPRMIDFKLSTTPSASLLHENTCLHIAYAQSVDERWVTAAWTDNRGSLQMTASYCLGRKGKAIATPFVDVVREIWESTHEMISTRKVSWRIIITKCGMMDQSEIDLWSSLAQTESRATVTLTLIAVDTDPSLQLLPPEVKVTNNTAGVFFTTPVSTPQPSMVSPEQSGNPPTPSLRDATSAPTPGGPGDAAAESDAEATLTDVTDHTWGSILAHRLNNSTSLTELSPSIVSGYLVKKGGSRLEDPPTVMEVNIVHNEGNPRAYETLLREMLTYFRGLGTLARARGMTDRETDIRPWHIAAAENGSRALYNLM